MEAGLLELWKLGFSNFGSWASRASDQPPILATFTAHVERTHETEQRSSRRSYMALVIRRKESLVRA